MAKPPAPKTKTDWLHKHDLTDMQRLFVLAYLKTKVAVQAATEAGYKQPETMGPRQFRKVQVQAAIAEGRAEIEAVAQVSAEAVLTEMWGTYNADPSAMTRVERCACRYCHGTDHEYQWRTAREYRAALTSAADAISGGDASLHTAIMSGTLDDARIPTDLGGYGYKATARPHPDCPECDGAGWPDVFIADTRDLTPEQRRLFDGAKINTKGQIEVVQLDRAAALDRVARHLGMYEGKGEAGNVGRLGDALMRLMDTTQTVPIAPDDPAKRMARAHRRITTTTTVTEADEEEP